MNGSFAMSQKLYFKEEEPYSVSWKIYNSSLKKASNPETLQTFNFFDFNMFKEQIKNKLLNVLPNTDLQSLLSSMKMVQLEKNQYIYSPKDYVNYIYFPIDAVISEYQILENGKTIELSLIGWEGMIGEGAVFNSDLSPNWLQVLIPGNALQIDSKIFRREFDNSKNIKDVLFAYMNLYISHISQKVICNSHHSVEERLCLWLLMVDDRSKDKYLPLTQEQIACFLGTYRPSITLITQSLRQEKMIESIRGKITILDREKLEAMSCHCYSVMKEF